MQPGSTVFICWAAAVALSDCRYRRVSNGLVATGLVAAAVCSVTQAGPFPVAPLQAAGGAALGFAVLLPFFLLGVMGAADVKVFAALGAWCGVHALIGLWVLASLAAALHALALIVMARRSRQPWRTANAPTFAVGARRAAPYAALLVGAGVIALLGAPLPGVAH